VGIAGRDPTKTTDELAGKKRDSTQPVFNRTSGVDWDERSGGPERLGMPSGFLCVQLCGLGASLSELFTCCTWKDKDGGQGARFRKRTSLSVIASSARRQRARTVMVFRPAELHGRALAPGIRPETTNYTSDGESANAGELCVSRVLALLNLYLSELSLVFYHVSPLPSS